jgi:hypothetical protein
MDNYSMFDATPCGFAYNTDAPTKWSVLIMVGLCVFYFILAGVYVMSGVSIWRVSDNSIQDPQEQKVANGFSKFGAVILVLTGALLAINIVKLGVKMPQLLKYMGDLSW